MSTEETSTWDDTPATNATADFETITKDSAPTEATDGATAQTEPAAAVESDPVNEAPVFDEEKPHGRLVNAAPAHFIQEGSIFGIDKKYLGSAQEL